MDNHIELDKSKEPSEENLSIDYEQQKKFIQKEMKVLNQPNGKKFM